VNQEAISPEDLKVLMEERKDAVEAYKALRGILVIYEKNVDDIPEPKKRTGARGPRGKRILQGFDYYIDGELRTEKQNSLSSIANTLGKPLDWKTADLRKFLTDEGIDLENPGEGFTVMLPDPINKELRAERGEIQVVVDEDENGDEDDEDDEDDTE
jgi:hypothetical protein